MTDRRDWWVLAGMAVAAASAAVASFTGLRGLAVAAGWPDRLAWLLPLTIDAHAVTATRVWLSAATPPSAHRFARVNALGAIAVSTAGNAAYHALDAGLLRPSWPLVVLVGAVPATVLGLTVHLASLRGRPAAVPASLPEQPAAVLSASPVRPSRRARHRSEDDLIAAARAADARHRAAHGRPITRDALRTALRVSGTRATDLRRQIAAEPAPEPVPDRKEVTTSR